MSVCSRRPSQEGLASGVIGCGSGRSRSMALRSGSRMVADPSESRQTGARGQAQSLGGDGSADLPGDDGGALAERRDPFPAPALEAPGQVAAEVVAGALALEAHIDHPEVARLLEAVERLIGGILDRHDRGPDAEALEPRHGVVGTAAVLVGAAEECRVQLAVEELVVIR